MNWHDKSEPLPEDGSICDIVISESDKGIGLLCAIVKNGRLMLDGLDLTDDILKWHKVPGVVSKDGYVLWDRKERIRNNGTKRRMPCSDL